MFRATTLLRRTFASSASSSVNATTTTTTTTKANGSRIYVYLGGAVAIVGGSYLGYKAWQWHLTNDKRLSPDRYVALELIDKQQLTSDAYRLRLATEAQPDHEFPILSCLYIKDDNIQVMRAYTPINDPYKDGHVDLVVKRYAHGSISKMLARTQLHESVFVRGPMEEYPYQPNSLKSEIGMIAGGTGITPMYQLIKRVLNNPDDKTERLWLIYCNKTEKDILLKKELDELKENHKDRLHILYVLDHPPQDWQGGRGYVSQDMIRSMLTQKENSFVFVCGPDAMLAHVSGQRARDFSQGSVRGLLGQMGFASNQVWKLE
ncbi:hypothetical protein BDB00DRAFT_767111 [Zychaea mexicana]|uniref:uncharacterized protein n=1 Tax=Zychaea mexicana TaxID=64656 RepID=UPI0022FE330F|nr:uncharacterized protein BDB00DRAFT_767111 [Zychaea mexicana]KAI9491366.1 hypothetical protein BDB00DRAFT_767111 [Zychaea mexicana]